MSEDPSLACSHHALCILAVNNLLSADKRVVIVQISNGPNLQGILRGNVHVLGNDVKLLVPTGEGIACAYRFGRCYCRLTMFYFLRAKRGAVVVEEGNEILIFLVLCRYCQVCLDVTEILIPADEGITLAFRLPRCCGGVAYFDDLGI